VDLLKRIETTIEESLTARGYNLVRVQLSGGNRKVLQIMVERLDDKPITVDDCTTVSRLVSVLLDVSDPIKDPYILEVSSPGLERPLVKLKDYQRFCGQMVHVTTHQPVNERKRFQGRLTSADEHGITLELEATPVEELATVTIELENVRAARLLVDFEAL
jgi:ribosome maturation factor RimP